MNLIDELKRRNVFKVGISYVLLGWLIIQVTDTVAPALKLPDWTLTFVTWIGIIGFPVAIFFAWAYELTPSGIKPESEVDRGKSITHQTGRQLNIVVIALLVVAVGFMLWNGYGRDTSLDAAQTDANTATSMGASGSSIAVLPLTNLSSITENAFFAAGVHEEILTNLSRIEGLRVVSRTTALRYLDSKLSLRDIGRELGVRYIVEGSVRRIDNHVRITVQLIDALEDAHLWASNYDRELVDVFATQSQVAKEITNSLHLEVQPQSVGVLDEMPTQSVRAYDLYMKAVSLERSKPESESMVQRQRELLEAAVEEDPNFAEAWGLLNENLDWIARLILQYDWFGDTDEERNAALQEVRQAAQRSLDKAIALDPDNLQTLLAQASDYVLEQQSAEYSTGRRKYIDRAIELYPDSAFAWYVLAWWQRLNGDWPTATEYFQKALELDPLHARIVEGSLTHFRTLGDQEMTTRLFERLAQIAPEKGADQALGEITGEALVGDLFAAFAETADTSLFDKIAAELGNASTSYFVQSNALYFRAWLLEVQNDVDGLASLDTDGVLPGDPQIWELFIYLSALDLVMAAQRLTGRDEEARATARHIIDITRPDRVDSGYIDSIMLKRMEYPTAAARILLGQKDDLDLLKERLLRENISQAQGGVEWPLYVLSQLDLDQAVRLILDRKARHPGWYGTDVYATHHVALRHVVTHPLMQDFYVAEGKWVAFLAERVPEYAAYR